MFHRRHIAKKCGRPQSIKIAFLRLLEQKYACFQGEGRANCYWTGFQEEGSYDPQLGYGWVSTNASGGTVLVWVYVDDFLIHAPTQEMCQEGLRLFMDTALDCGLLCHPDKLVPPTLSYGERTVKGEGEINDLEGICAGMTRQA